MQQHAEREGRLNGRSFCFKDFVHEQNRLLYLPASQEYYPMNHFSEHEERLGRGFKAGTIGKWPNIASLREDSEDKFWRERENILSPSNKIV